MVDAGIEPATYRLSDRATTAPINAVQITSRYARSLTGRAPVGRTEPELQLGNFVTVPPRL